MEGTSLRSADLAAAQLAASIASYGLAMPKTEILDARHGSARAAFARQVAMYLCHTGLELSLARVANAFGRDRSTVAHACHAVEDRREQPHFDFWIGALEAMLRCAPGPKPELGL